MEGLAAGVDRRRPGSRVGAVGAGHRGRQRAAPPRRRGPFEAPRRIAAQRAPVVGVEGRPRRRLRPAIAARRASAVAAAAVASAGRVRGSDGSRGARATSSRSRASRAARYAASRRPTIARRVMGRCCHGRPRRSVALCHDPRMELTFLGGARTVTGSRHLVDTGRARVLVDCGMFQGGPAESMRNRVPLGVDPTTLDAVVLTHAHLDHCGLLPLLVREGFRGSIVCTAATAELARLVLLDSAKLQEEFAKRAARRERQDPERAAADDARDERLYDEAVDAGAAGAESPGGPDPEDLLRAAGPEVDARLRRAAVHGGRRQRRRCRCSATSRTAWSTRWRRASTSRCSTPGTSWLVDRADAADGARRRARHRHRVLGRPRAGRARRSCATPRRSPRPTSSCASPRTAAGSTRPPTARSRRWPRSVRETRQAARACC